MDRYTVLKERLRFLLQDKSPVLFLFFHQRRRILRVEWVNIPEGSEEYEWHFHLYRHKFFAEQNHVEVIHLPAIKLAKPPRAHSVQPVHSRVQSPARFQKQTTKQPTAIESDRQFHLPLRLSPTIAVHKIAMQNLEHSQRYWNNAVHKNPTSRRFDELSGARKMQLAPRVQCSLHILLPLEDRREESVSREATDLFP